MKAGEIKYYLHQNFLKEYSDCPDSLITDELKVCGGRAIADVAVINGKMICYEIKSDYDSLQRLKNQISNYDLVFDLITIIVGEKFEDKISEFVPNHWGVWSIKTNKKGPFINVARKPKVNKNVDAFSIAQFLWKDEALHLIDKYKVKGSFKSKRKWLLWEALSNELPLKTLKSEVREILRNRNDWKTSSFFNSIT